MTGVVVVGCGSTAALAHHYLSRDSAHEVVAFAADRDHIQDKSRFRDLPLVPLDEVTSRFPPEEHAMFVAVGYGRVNRFRAEKCDQGRELGYRLISYVSTRASIWTDLEMGDNCFVMPDVIIEPFVQLGSDVILWNGSHVSHDSVIGDHCFLSSQSVVGGQVRLGPYTFVGINAAIRDRVTIAESCVIGAGAVVLRNTRPREVFSGHGARLLGVPSNRLVSL
jgi:sugar O-acyltransferase (sialic acid O-acetyltransferase NeuD family)